MLLTKKIKIKINKGNIPIYKQFKELQYLKINDEIDLDIKYIAKSNRSKVDTKCDICGEMFNISYYNYNKSTKNQTEIYTCKICSNIKREKTNMKLYGVKNCFQNETMKTKSKETMKEKYGHEHNMQCEEFLNARIETYKINWGVDNPSKSEIIKRKKEKTCFKNYGVKSPYQNKDVFEKSRKNSLELKKYKNTKLFYQASYEKDFLDKYYNKLNIENGISINYIFNNKEKVYHSDFYIKEFDLIIEIKSIYWYNEQLEQNIQKEKYSKIHHNFILIMNKNYDEFEKNYPSKL